MANRTVGNIPYDISEEQLVNVFSEVGRVVAFRLVSDKEQGKFKGYGFCEYEDAETAASAVRNLNEVEVGGRALRLDFADMDPMAENNKDSSRAQSMAPFPGGAPLPPGISSTDAITHTIASLPPHQLMDILTQMKSLTNTSPEQARAVLQSNPQLAYAVFHAMLMMNVVDPVVVQRVLGESGAMHAPPAAPAPAASAPPIQPTAAPKMEARRPPAPSPTPAPAPQLDDQQRVRTSLRTNPSNS
ncbi:hypothetical protein MPSI1_001110 [Malassezia psittaci]|uniref:RRM domain-containing protein n=1 Tax=Malassezia psittaci TaxID=1821823 RepID=A0AAF0JDJ8_9BASI|nr:hypothetical protein MPSI1_001110 [Malassezia psittaci]